MRETIDVSAWKEAYLRAIAHYAPIWQQQEIASLYFGGGTPSLMPPEIVETIITAFHINPDTTEITLEANPTSVEAEKLRAFKQAGINRVSMGVQALNVEDLAFLGRKHSLEEALQAISMAGELFERVNFDLIYGRPTQTIATWEAELQQAIPLMKGHASLYQLTIEKGTPFYARHKRGEFALPSEEVQAEMLELTYATMEAHNMPYYEVSNFATPGQESQHNLRYWHYDSYLGIGPGAHSRLIEADGAIAMMDQHNPESWLKQVAEHGHGQQQRNNISKADAMQEAMMMGLRLREGIDLQAFETQFNASASTLCNPTAFMQLCDAGLLEQTDTHLRTTQAGIAVLNSLLANLLL